MTTTHTHKISIILPTYNGAKLIRRSIESCLNQTHQNIELIIVDDCSNDKTPEIIKSFNDPRIKSIRNQTNQRLPRSLNIGFVASTGDYLTWTSDDNEFLPNALEVMLDFLVRNPDVDFVYSDMIVRYFESGKEVLRKFTEPNLEKENNIGASYLYKRKIFETIGGYDPRFEWVEDYDYWIRVGKQFRMRHYPKPLYIYGDHEHSLTSTRRYPIVMMRDALRYWHGYLSLGEFTEAIRQFSVDVRTNIQGRQKQWAAFHQAISKIYGISVLFGLQCSFLFCFLVAKRLLNVLLRPLVVPVQKSFADRRFRSVCASLTADSDVTNVLCIIPAMVVGGSEKVIWDVVRGLGNYGYHFHLICERKEDNEWCRKFASSFKNVVLLKPFADDEEFGRYLSEMVRRLGINILLNTNSRPGYRCLPELKKKFPHLKAVDIIHLEDVGGAIEKYAWVANYMDQRVCISQHLKDYMKKIYSAQGVESKLVNKIQVIHNGADRPDHYSLKPRTEEFRRNYDISAESVVISFVGRMAVEKNPTLFVEIARILKERSPHVRWKFIMAGDGPYLSKVHSRIYEDKLQDHFVLLGMVSDVAPILANSFLLTVISRHEGIPLVLQEALALNVPVLSTNVGAIRELVHNGINGFLIALDESVVENFVQKILLLVLDRDVYAKLRVSAQETLYPEFSKERMIGRYRDIFQDLTEGHAG